MLCVSAGVTGSLAPWDAKSSVYRLFVSRVYVSIYQDIYHPIIRVFTFYPFISSFECDLFLQKGPLAPHQLVENTGRLSTIVSIPRSPSTLRSASSPPAVCSPLYAPRRVFCSSAQSYLEFRHYGLASEIFLCIPLWRYADVVAHRQLAAAVGYETLHDSARSRGKLESVCNTIDVRHQKAQLAGRASIEYDSD